MLFTADRAISNQVAGRKCIRSSTEGDSQVRGWLNDGHQLSLKAQRAT
jgi:hypothetical protein